MFKSRPILIMVTLAVLLSVTGGQVSYAVGDLQGEQMQSYAPAADRPVCDPNFSWDPQLQKCVCREPRKYEPWSGECKKGDEDPPQHEECFCKSTTVEGSQNCCQ